MVEGKRKGSVDTTIIFSVMEKMYEKEDFNKIIRLISEKVRNS